MNQITPFSNGTEFDTWKENNCDQCKKYESESSTPEEAGCRLAFWLDMGSISGTVAEDVCNEIGRNGEQLNDRCAKIEVKE